MHRCGARIRVFWLLMAATSLVSAVADPGTIGKYVYPDGQVVYSDKPVPGAKLEKEIKADTGPAAQPPPAGAVPGASEKPAAAAPPNAPARVNEELGPVIAETRNGDCHMWVQGEGEIFAVKAEGFVPGESLEVTSVSDGEKISATGTAREDGTYSTVLFAAVWGRSSGEVTFTLRGSRCQVMVTFPWQR